MGTGDSSPWARYVTSGGVSPASLVLSVVVHALLVGGSIAATMVATDLDGVADADRPVFLAPPPRERPALVAERLDFVTVGAPPQLVAGDVVVPDPVSESSQVMAEGQQVDSIDVVNSAGTPYADSVFTEIEVDSVATRSELSVAPAFPASMLKQGIEGIVIVRFVVDTTGLADSATLEPVSFSQAEFLASVTEALPHMRFRSARIGRRRVRQLVEQSFAFRIQKP